MKRYSVAVICCFVFICAYCVRININITIIHMVRQLNSTEEQKANSNLSTIPYVRSIPVFDWDDKTQQYILGSFYYGYTLGAIPGGWLVSKTSGKPAVIFYLIWQNVLAALTPWASGVSSNVLITIRVLEGLAEGLLIPAFYATIKRWIVPQERSTIISIGLSGMGIAEVICYPISIWISSSFSGWPISYYTYCAFSAIVLIVFMIFVYDDPEDDPFISNNELIYLKSFNDTYSTKDTYNVPFCDLMTSTAVWSIIIGFTVYVITVVFILTEAPVFASLILGFDKKNIGLITSISAILEYIVTILSGICADIIIRRKYLKVVNTRKMFMILTTGIPALCMSCIGYFNAIVSMTLLTLSFGCIGSYTTSIMTNIIEVSKERSEVIMGIMSFTGHGAAFIIILLFGMLIQDGNTASQWSLMFRIIAGINLFGMIFFLMFAKAEQLTKSDGNITKQEMKSYKTIKD